MTIAQIHNAKKMNDAENSEFWLNGRLLANISVVGVIREMNPAMSTKSTFKIDDGTGLWMEVQQWHQNTDNEAMDRGNLEIGKMMRVFGQIREYQNTRRVQGFRCKVVEDSNVLTFHMLECIAHYVAAEKQSTIPARPSGNGSLGGTAMAAGSVYGQQQEANSGSSDNFSSEQSKVMAAISAIDTDEGASIQDIVSKLSSEMAEPKIRAVIDQLNDDGHVYSTIDEEHFRSVAD